MKFFTTCMLCFEEDGNPLNSDMQWHDIDDSGAYLHECPRGHKSIAIAQDFKFEVLFELGACALLDEYPGEAITRFSSALERFYEFFIQVISIKHGLSEEILKQSWKKISKRSERQLGAYLFLYALEFGELPSPYPETMKPDGHPYEWQNFRNMVVHNGYIPTSVEALAYGELVYDFIQGELQRLKKHASEECHKITFFTLRDAYLNKKKELGLSEDIKQVTCSMGRIISTASGMTPPKFAEALVQLKSTKEQLYKSGLSR